MNTRNTQRWLVWSVVFLFLTNAATLATILYHNYQQNRSENSLVIAGGYRGNAVNGRFFRQTLGFTPAQMQVFREANQRFRPQTAALTAAIDSLKAGMFREMQKQPPDTAHLNLLSRKIGELHAALKLETYRFYLSIRETCSEPQQAQLEKLFEPLFINENLSVTPGGRQYGWNSLNN